MESKWHLLSLDDIAKEFVVITEQGLSEEEVVERRKKYGPNNLPQGKKLHWWQLFLRQFINPLVFILLIAAGMTLWLKEYIDMSVILLSVGVNASIGFWQEFRSNKIFERLQAIVKVEARVRRGGRVYDLIASELVPGDVIILKSGMKVPADARLFSTLELEANEALLTGESVPVKKEVKMLSGSVSIGDRVNMIHTGTVIEKGEGEAIVVATGSKTEIGQIAQLTTAVEEEQTPLQERLSKLGKMISIIVVVSALLILGSGIFEGRGFVEMFTVAVAVAVAAIPEGLPAALSVILAVASQKIFRRQGLVKKIIGAETLGSTTVICTDKTGTLTEGKMKVEQILRAKDENRAVQILALANEAIAFEEKGKREIRGEVTDRAKLEFFFEHGGDLDKTLQEFPRLMLLPFDEEEKYIASLHSSSDGQQLLFVTGAPEKLLAISVLDEQESGQIKKDIEEYAKRGFRMIGIAERKIPASVSFNPNDGTALRGYVNQLDFVGMVAIGDPIRPDVLESTTRTREAGIRIVMVTGDHKLTALAIGQELGFCHDNANVIDGDEMDKLSDEELAKHIKEVNIFARVNPKHKMRIVQALKSNGEVVAMTGDGVNDAPALKAADVGISLGSGTDVTKEAADLVLLNDSFSIITGAIEQGRIAFDNMRKVVVFLLMGSFTELIIILSSLIFKIDLPITAVMILWANIVEDGFPNFALAFEPGDKHIMKRKPLKRKEPILDKESMAFVFIQGIVTDLVLVSVFLLLDFYSGYSLERIQTIIFAALTIDSLFLVFSLKDFHEYLFKINFFDNLYLLFAVGLGFLAIIGAIYLPFLNWLLETVPLGIYDWAIILSLTIFEVLFVEVIKWYFKRNEKPEVVPIC